GQHADADPVLAQRLERAGGALLDRIGDRDEAGGASVHRDQHDTLRVLPQRIGPFEQLVGRDAEGCEKRPVADSNALAIDGPNYALAGLRSEVVDRLEREAALFGRPDDRRGERVLAAA